MGRLPLKNQVIFILLNGPVLEGLQWILVCFVLNCFIRCRYLIVLSYLCVIWVTGITVSESFFFFPPNFCLRIRGFLSQIAFSLI